MQNDWRCMHVIMNKLRTFAANDITLIPSKIVRISENCRRLAIYECKNERIAELLLPMTSQNFLQKLSESQEKCRRSTICECNNGRIANFCCQRHHYDSARNRPNLRKTCRRLAIYERTNERIFRTIAANDITLFPPKIVRISEKCRRSTICECHRGRIANFCCH